MMNRNRKSFDNSKSVQNKGLHNINKIHFSLLSLVIIAVLLFPGCNSKKEMPPQSTMVSVAKAVALPTALSISAVGSVEPTETVTIRSQVNGIIVSVNFKEGEEVKEGQLLFQIDPLPFQITLESAKAQLAKDKALAKNAENQANRYADLVKKDYVTRDQYETSLAQAEMYKAIVQADEAAVKQAKLNLDYTSIRATIAGKTGALLVHKGLLVKTNDTALLVINKLRPIYVNFAIPGSQLPLVQKYATQNKLEVRVKPSRENANTEIKGYLFFSDNAVNPDTGTITLKGIFSNEEGVLWPGQFVDTELILTIENNALTVPSAAIVAGQEGTFVFVVGNDKKAEKRSVIINRTMDGIAVIDEGLSPGETVIIDGQMRLVPGSSVEIKSGLGGKTDKRSKT